MQVLWEYRQYSKEYADKLQQQMQLKHNQEWGKPTDLQYLARLVSITNYTYGYIWKTTKESE